MGTYTCEDLELRYQKLTGTAIVHATLTSELVGGAPADREGAETFVKHHLKLEGTNAEDAVQRILSEEVKRLGPVVEDEKDQAAAPVLGTQDASTQELVEHATYGMSIIRCDGYGPWLGEWMIKACIKAACTRTNCFTSVKHMKGACVEMGRVDAVDYSLARPAGLKYSHYADVEGRIHIVGPQEEDGVAVLINKPAPTYFKVFKGRVTTSKGPMSIVSHKQCIAPGARFAFTFRWFANIPLTEDKLLDVFAAAGNIGLGSAKSFERGKFAIDELDINLNKP